MKYDCLIIDDEEVLAKNTCEYFNMFDVKTKAERLYGKSVFKNDLGRDTLPLKKEFDYSSRLVYTNTGEISVIAI